jgi:hypothetical protein
MSLQSLAGGVPLTTTSNDVGYYRFPLVRPGTYVLTAKKNGFATVVVNDVTLQIGQTANVDISMKPGEVAQELTVSASAAVLDSQTSTLGGVVPDQPIKQIPIVLRDSTSLVSLVPGVTSEMRTFPGGDPQAGLGLLYTTRLNYTMNGGIREMAVQYVDGIDVTFSGGGFQATPLVISPDFTQEFKVLTNNLPAEFGRGSGAVNIITKSGSNSYHGTVYEFLQNDNLNANDLFANARGAKKPETKRNQYGYAVGGPILKNKLWFFTDFEQLRHTRFQSVLTRVPTANERAGNFSNLFTSDGQPVTIYNPFDTYVDTDGRIKRRPFPNNQIPANLLDTFGKNLTSFYPLPNNPGVLGPGGLPTQVGNLFVASNPPINFDRFDVKGDYNLGTQHKFMGRFSRVQFVGKPVDAFNNPANPWTLSQRDYKEIGKNLVLSWTWTASPSLVITQSGNMTRDHNFSFNGSQGFDPSPLGGPFSNDKVLDFAKFWGGGSAFPTVNVTGYSPMGGSSISGYYNQQMTGYGYQVGLNKSSGRHLYKAGFQLRIGQQGELTFPGYVGDYTYTGSFTRGPDPLVPSAFSGNAYADMLLGLLGGGGFTTGYSIFQTSKYFGWYFQDDIRLTPKLTLNLGLRYDFEHPFTERYNHSTRFDPEYANPVGDQSGPNTGGQTLNQYFTNLVGRPIQGSLIFPTTPGGNGRGISPTDYTGLQPRLGLAYKITEKLVLRGGFSKLNFLPSGSAALTFGLGTASINTPIVGSIDGIHPAVSITDPFPAGFNTPIYDTQGTNSLLGQNISLGTTNNRTPYQWQWNAGFEYALPGDAVLTVNYAGSRSHHLWCPSFFCGDQIARADIAKYGARVFDTVPNPFFGIITDPTAPLSASTVQLGQLLKQYPQYASWTSAVGSPYQGPSPDHDTFRNAWDSLQVGYRKNYAKGLTLIVAYTASKNLTNSDSFDAGWGGVSTGYQDLVTFEGERSLSAEDVSQRLVIGHVYELPFGKNKRFGSHLNPVLDKIVGGWQWSGQTNFQTGFPLPISVAGVTSGAFGGLVRPNLVSDPCMDPGRSRGEKIQEYLNPAAFAAPANFTFGNAPRNLNCRADGIKNFDIGLLKVTPIKESINVEFRTEFFNAFNRPQLGFPDTTFQGPTFGQITTQYNQPRIIQFGLKVNF